jgi:hypothetical protein
MMKMFTIKRWAWLGFTILTVVYISTIVNHSINVPFSDDFHQQLYTVITLEKGGEVSDALFRQHNEHRLLTTHVFSYLEHAISGKINLDRQLLVAIFFLIALVIVVSSYSNKEHRPIVLLLVSMFILSPEHGALWVGGTTQYYSLILFSILSVRWLTKIDKPLFLVGSIISMFLAIYSMIAGVLLPLVVIAYLVWNRKISTFPALIWVGSSIVSVLWYFQGFVKNENKASIFFFLEEPAFTVEFTFRVLGNFMSDLIELDVLVFLTVLCVVVFVYLIAVKASFVKFFASIDGAAFISVLLITGAVVVGRVGFESSNMAYADRYFVFTKTLWLLGLIILLNRQLISKNVLAFILGFSTLYMMSTYQSEVKNLKHYEQQQSHAMLDFLVRDNPQGFEFNNKHQEAAQIVKQAIELEVYQPGLRPTPSRQLKYLKHTDFNDGLQATVVRDARAGQYRYFAFIIENRSDVHEVALVPRGVSGPATLLQAAAKVELKRLDKIDLQVAGDAEDVYEVVIDMSKYDSALSYDIHVISLGKITTIGSM